MNTFITKVFRLFPPCIYNNPWEKAFQTNHLDGSLIIKRIPNFQFGIAYHTLQPAHHQHIKNKDHFPSHFSHSKIVQQQQKIDSREKKTIFSTDPLSAFCRLDFDAIFPQHINVCLSLPLYPFCILAQLSAFWAHFPAKVKNIYMYSIIISVSCKFVSVSINFQTEKNLQKEKICERFFLAAKFLPYIIAASIFGRTKSFLLF